jgi:hypothetical protein
MQWLLLAVGQVSGGRSDVGQMLRPPVPVAGYDITYLVSFLDVLVPLLRYCVSYILCIPSSPPQLHTTLCAKTEVSTVYLFYVLVLTRT